MAVHATGNEMGVQDSHVPIGAADRGNERAATSRDLLLPGVVPEGDERDVLQGISRQDHEPAAELPPVVLADGAVRV